MDVRSRHIKNLLTLGKAFMMNAYGCTWDFYIFSCIFKNSAYTLKLNFD